MLPLSRPANTEQAIVDALARLTPGQSGLGRLLEAPGLPPAPLEPSARTETVAADAHVTAVRRIPAVAAAFAPFPASLDPPPHRGARRARHRRALHAPGRGDRPRARRDATSWSSRRPRPARRSATTRRCSTRSCSDPSARALYLFPTKALAQDQLAELQATRARSSDAMRTQRDDRRLHLRRRHAAGRAPRDPRRAHVVLSNPDMLHAGILPHHPRWAKLFENLRYVVIDELHAYRGVFGSHLANVLRRLRRICRHYGSTPTFICSSATIANPRELAERLTERAVRARRARAARRAARSSSSSSTRRSSTSSSGIRRSYLAESAPRRARVPASATCSSSCSRRAGWPPRS